MKNNIDPIPEALNELAEKVIGAAIEVHRALGPGFQEIAYRRALEIELRLRGIQFEVEVPVSLEYKGEGIGQGRIDLLIERELVIELKAAEANPKKYTKQASLYLTATNHRLALIINFESERLVDGIASCQLNSTALLCALRASVSSVQNRRGENK